MKEKGPWKKIKSNDIVMADISEILYQREILSDIVLTISLSSPERQQGPVLSSQVPSDQGSLCQLTRPGQKQENIVVIIVPFTINMTINIQYVNMTK